MSLFLLGAEVYATGGRTHASRTTVRAGVRRRRTRRAVAHAAGTGSAAAPTGPATGVLLTAVAIRRFLRRHAAPAAEVARPVGAAAEPVPAA